MSDGRIDQPRNDDWPRVEALLAAALELPQDARASFLQSACAGDEVLRGEVEAFLAASERPGRLDTPVAALTALMTAVEHTGSSTPLESGSRVGPYVVGALIGAGGMGRVYRARDLRLARDVALKVLPIQFVTNADRLARFEREARALASLNHPNIAAIYGVEEYPRSPQSGSVVPGRALVLELVDGPTLADRIAGRRLPLAEALGIARQIAEALATAHGRGVIHRDLKPANVKIRPDGLVKVLDFGLARILDPVPLADAATTPAVASGPSSMSTRSGVVLGTASYMSPEQAVGEAADTRADIWAFGVVLYEMLSGVAPFRGETTSDVLREVLRAEPDWNRLPPETPAAIRRLLKRCLRKEPARRLHDIVDARLEIDEVGSEPATEPGRPRAGRSLLWGLAAALALVTTVAAVQSLRLWRQLALPVAEETRLEIPIPFGSLSDVGTAAISPDGRSVAYRSTSGGAAQLWVRSLDSVTPRPLRGTANATFPFWSPDGRSLGFFADGRLKRLDLDGGAIRILADASLGRGGAWSADGTIVFAPLFSGPLLRVPANGGLPAEATRLASGQVGHERPQLLPDGRHLLYSANGLPDVSGIYIGSLGGPGAVRLTDAQAAAFHSASGRLLFIRQNELFAQPFDLDRLVLTSNPSPVAEPASGIAVSNAGPIAYHAASPTGKRRFTWFDRTGRELGGIGEPLGGGSGDPALSPDGTQVALGRTVDDNSDIWLLETARGVLSRFTSEAANNFSPRWSPDGKTIVFNSNRSGLFELWTKPVGAAGGEERLLATGQNISATDWSGDGQFILFRSVDPVTSHDLWALPLTGDRKPFPVVRTPFIEPYGRFAPDGKWVAYQSNESGRPEVYVQSFPSAGARVRISTNGGTQMDWRRDGRELYYMSLDNRLMAVPIRLGSNGASLEPGAPTALFDARIGTDPAVALNGNGLSYAVDPDGSRFFINEMVEGTPSTTIVVILNWKPRE